MIDISKCPAVTKRILENRSHQIYVIFLNTVSVIVVYKISTGVLSICHVYVMFRLLCTVGKQQFSGWRPLNDN